jgi:urea carboxylase
VLHLNETQAHGEAVGFAAYEPNYDGLSDDLIPALSNEWEIGVLDGPHAAPDFLTPADVRMFFETAWKVHYNSARTGVRLIGPKPKWARKDGGDAGLHPSNIHDVAYAVGAIDFTGDMPIILGPDGPSCGGFVCPAVIVQSELWKIGQLRPGDVVRFIPMSEPAAFDAEYRQNIGEPTAISPAITSESREPVLHRIESPVKVEYRQAGDKYLLVEYGQMVLDFDLRFRVHALMRWLEEDPLPGVIDLTPGIRSLQIHFDNSVLPRGELLDALIDAESQLPATDDIVVPSRIVHLPLSWEDPATLLAIEKYMQSVRADAPWCPSNLEFIRRINGLNSIDDVKNIVFDASYLVLALGDVYLGAPVATPIDPRHRLVTTKYNPARTWTAENSVGIGGAYLCIYGMEGPGGYQFVGRTCQMYNRYRETDDFVAGKPWLLRFFDQVKFYPVSAEELLKFRAAFALGRVKLDIEETTFSLRDYHTFCRENQKSIDAFRRTQQAAFAAERQRWEIAGEFRAAEEAQNATAVVSTDKIEIPPGAEAIESPMVANVWKINCTTGQHVKAGEVLVILEAMKMEVNISAPADGTVLQVVCKAGQMVMPGAALCVFAAKC